MRALRLSVLVPFVLVACGGDPPRVAAPAPSAMAAPAASAAASAAPVAADSSPTQLTAQQKARDDARRPLADAITGAYSNYEARFSPDRKKIVFGSRRSGNREIYLADVARPDAPPLASRKGPSARRPRSSPATASRSSSCATPAPMRTSGSTRSASTGRTRRA